MHTVGGRHPHVDVAYDLCNTMSLTVTSFVCLLGVVLYTSNQIPRPVNGEQGIDSVQVVIRSSGLIFFTEGWGPLFLLCVRVCVCVGMLWRGVSAESEVRSCMSVERMGGGYLVFCKQSHGGCLFGRVCLPIFSLLHLTR